MRPCNSQELCDSSWLSWRILTLIMPSQFVSLWLTWVVVQRALQACSNAFIESLFTLPFSYQRTRLEVREEELEEDMYSSSRRGERYLPPFSHFSILCPLFFSDGHESNFHPFSLSWVGKDKASIQFHCICNAKCVRMKNASALLSSRFRRELPTNWMWLRSMRPSKCG